VIQSSASMIRGGKHSINLNQNSFNTDGPVFEKLSIGDIVTVEVWDDWYWTLWMRNIRSIIRHLPTNSIFC